MSLSKDIVIKNEFTNNARGRGSRGASPGQYVTRYMAREDATEVLTPIQVITPDAYDSHSFMRYMIRENATEKLKQKDDDILIHADEHTHGSPLVLKHSFKRQEKLAGRAFGSKGISLSHDELIESSDEIQKAFDEGHTVQKIVLSFTEKYLRDTEVLDSNFKHRGRGSYRGQIDQLKLRRAISNGVENMMKAGGYVNPEWVGTIQVDTSHVHAHLALVDKEFSPKRRASDGADRGKINKREQDMFRKGIHYTLEDTKDLKAFHQQTSLERRNTVTFIKDYAYSTMYNNSSMQILIASLPKDRQHWRYSSNRKSMQYANKIATQIVERVFENEPEKSGYKKAMDAVNHYADESARLNGLNTDERQKLVDNGRERIIERSVNGLYGVIKKLDPKLLHVRTPMIDVQSRSDEELVQAMSRQTEKREFDLVDFSLRVRGYHEREQEHRDVADSIYDLIQEYDEAERAGYVDHTAHVMRLFYEEEMRYRMGLTDKYRTFLSFHHPRDRQLVDLLSPEHKHLTEWFNDITEREQRFGVVFDDERNEYMQNLRKYSFDTFYYGVGSLKEWQSIHEFTDDKVQTNFVLPVAPRVRMDNLTQSHFNQVKAYDVHHLGLDYHNKPDIRISDINVKRFAEIFERRRLRTELADVYLKDTGQKLDLVERVKEDLHDMEKSVQVALNEGVIDVVTIDDLDIIDERQLETIPLDYTVDVTNEVRQAIERIELAREQEELDERGIQQAVEQTDDLEIN